jgi:SAM-dependent methyltransferase
MKLQENPIEAATADTSVPCPICGQADTRPFKSGIRHFHYPLEGIFATRKCNRCEVEWIYPPPTPEQIASFYPDEYYAHRDDASPTPWQRLVRFFGMRVRSGEPKFEAPGRMLDVGCGTGDALRMYKAKGWDVLGINFSSTTEKRGDILLGDFLTLNLPVDHFDYVRLNHTLEHLPDPIATLKKIRQLLKPGGTLMIGVPNSSSWAYRLFGQHWWYYGVPLHLYTFNRHSLEALLRRCGFDSLRFRLNSDYAGITGSIQIYLNRHTSKSSHEGFVFRSKLLRVVAHVAAKVTDIFGKGDCMEIVASRPRVPHA